MAHQNEASVEEILDSIKKVIARDNRDIANAARQRNATTFGPVKADIPLESSDEDESETAEEVLDLADMEFLEDEDVSDDNGNDNSDDHISPDEELDPQLTTATTRGAMRDNLAALAMLAQPGVPPQIVRSGETSLEGLTRDLMRPMLAEWLDKNLPALVEKLVQAEIAKIAGKRR